MIYKTSGSTLAKIFQNVPLLAVVVIDDPILDTDVLIAANLVLLSELSLIIYIRIIPKIVIVTITITHIQIFFILSIFNQ